MFISFDSLKQLCEAASLSDSTIPRRHLNLNLMMETRKFEARQLLKDKRFWVASFLIAWAAALQGHMMWVQRQDAFKHKFGNVNQEAEDADKQ